MIEAAKFLTVLSVALAFASAIETPHKRLLWLAALGGAAATIGCLILAALHQ